MTGTTKLDKFLSVLNDLIEGAKAHAHDPDNFLKINRDIGTLIESDLPALAEALAQGDIDPQDRARLEESLAGIRELEAKARARLVWSSDFEDYMRKAMSRED